MNILLFCVGLLLVALYDLPELLNKKQWRELGVFCVLFVAVFTLAFLQAINVNIPSPIKGIETLIKDILKISYP